MSENERISLSAEELENRFRPFTGLMSYYRCAMMEVETKFNVLNEEFSLRYDRNPIQDIRTRLKTPVSIFRKLSGRGLEISAASIEENLADVAGVRVICSFLADVYLLADALLGQDDITLVEIKDYIKHPKENGYRSLHLIVTVPIFLAQEKRLMKVEIQLRTLAMDTWASLEHQLRYKKDVDLSALMQTDLQECAVLAASLDEKMDCLRRRLKIDCPQREEDC